MGRRRECEGKARYEHRDQAEARVRDLQRGQLATRMHTYRCPHCGFWHVGHRPRRRHN